MAIDKLCWGDIEEVDDMDFVDGSNNEIKTVSEYKCERAVERHLWPKFGDAVHSDNVAKLYKCERAVERHLWPKFGDAVHSDNVAKLTMVSTEEIFLEKNPSGDTMSQKGGAVLMVCRTCGNKGDHWTSRCPYKDLVPEDDDKAGTFMGAYVPRGMKERQPGSEENNSVRVTNLSEDTHKGDLEELFRPFGQITRVSLPVDPNTGLSKGFGFVNFVMKDDAERAIAKVNGYGYDNLILRVDWASPRAN